MTTDQLVQTEIILRQKIKTLSESHREVMAELAQAGYDVTPIWRDLLATAMADVRELHSQQLGEPFRANFSLIGE